MDKAEIFAHIDHTLLKADATISEIARICAEAECYGAASVCIPPSFVARSRQKHPQLNICTAVSPMFPASPRATFAGCGSSIGCMRTPPSC